MQPYPTRPTSSTAVSDDWSRDDWTAFADRLLDGAMAWASPGRGRITPPGAAGGYGTDVDGLEGFARTFLLAGFRIAGERGEGVDHLIDFFSDGIRTGVDPDAPDRWVRLDEHPQAKVEAASLTLILDLTRPWIWDRLDARTQDRVIDYLAPVVGDDTYPRTNWLWFRVVVQTFLRSVGGPWSADDIAADLALHDSLAREDGWMSDGEERAFDHYVGWALHLYPVLWARMAGAQELAGDRTAADVAALDRYLQDAIALVGADGSPLIQGRSLIYRFAAAAPFWAGAIAGVPSIPAGALRHAAARIVGHFDANGAPDDRDLLTMGWHAEWRALAQSYSGPASPYWAVKGLIGLALPADHPVWAAPAEPLPIDRGDTLRAIAAPAWIVSATAADGIVRVVNHGTDKALPGTLVGESPLYARLGYSTATAPLLDERAWIDPLEQAVALVDADGAATHRSAIEPLGVRIDGQVGVGSSTWIAHTLAPAASPGHGQGLAGDATAVARVTVHSVVRGPWEVRLVRVDPLDDGPGVDELTLRVGGWPVAGERVFAQTVEAAARAAAGDVTSIVRALGDEPADPRVVQRLDASPLGGFAAVPFVELDVAPGTWHAMLLELTRTGAALAELGSPTAELTGTQAAISWPDGLRTTTDLIHPRPAAPSGR
ncbi:DUF2264 domain-containing protein [Microbacterium paludicola]|uniref:DUF2264 domain-containing protein n=1 Tax=Microbacterium paludicola TaxID=300019 RepID=UPI003879FEDA